MMQSAKSTLLYTAFAASIFVGLQFMQGTRDWLVLLSSGLAFMVFTYFSLRMVNRIIVFSTRGRIRKMAERREVERGPAVVAPTSDRPEHNRRRRERRRRR